MALPLRHILIGAILGDQESIPSIALPLAYSSGGSRNMWIDQDGSASSILGYTKQNPAAVVSNTGGAAMRVVALYHYIKQTAGVAVRQEIAIFDDGAAHWEFRYSIDVGVTNLFVSDLGASSAARLPDFAQAGNTLVMTNGVLIPQTWDGTTLAAAGSAQLAAPTITNGGAGNLVGNYVFRVLPIRTDGTRKSASVASAITFLNAARAGVAWIADTDVNVAGYEVYASTGSGKVLYLAGSVVGLATNTFTVNTADLDLIQNRPLQEYGDAPPTGAYFCEMHKERVWYGRLDSAPRKWFYADVGLPLSVYSAFNFIDMTDAESMSDFSTGATGNFKGMFVAWNERSVWTVSGTGSVIGALVDFNRRRASAKAGTVSHRTVARIPRGAKYVNADGGLAQTDDVTLAYLTPFADVRLFDGDNDEIISFPKARTLARLNYAQRAKAFCVSDSVRGEVTWIYPADSSDEPSLGVTWNYRFGVWYTRDWPFGFALEIEEANASSLLLAGEALLTKGGYLYLLWNGFTFDGSAIASQLMTKTLYGSGEYQDQSAGTTGNPLISNQKRWRWADLLFQVSGALSLTVGWLATEADDAAAVIASVSLAPMISMLETSDGSVIETSDGSILRVADTPTILRARFQDLSHFFNDGVSVNPKYLYSRGMRLRLSASSSTATWSMRGIDIVYQNLPGLKRTYTQ